MEWSRDVRIRMSLDGLLGDQPASEFLVVHERPRLAVHASVLGVAAVLAFAVAFESVRSEASVLIMLAILGPLRWSGRYWILARSGPSVLLAKSPTWFPKATRVVAVDRAPLSHAAIGGVLVKRYLLFDRQCVVPRTDHNQLLRIIS